LPHRAVVYSVRVYPRYHSKDLKPFGNFDGSGSALKTAINGYFRAGVFASANDDNTKSVVCESSSVVGDEVHSIFATGESGLAADIVDAKTNQLQFQQQPTHSQLLRCASVFRLEPNEKIGWWAAHVNNGRSAKGLVGRELLELFKGGHDNLTLKITPVVRGSDLQEAVDKDRMDSVTLVRLERPSDRAVVASSGKWLKAGEDARLELRIKPTHRVKKDLVNRFLKGDHAAFGDIVEFEGITFDEAKVQVELADGKHHTFNIEKPEAGHAFSVDLTGIDEVDGVPGPQSLFDGLRGAIDHLT
jgi:hypothetical protein